MKVFKKNLFNGELGGFKVSITESDTKVQSISDGFFELKFNIKHPVHTIALICAGDGNMDALKVVINLMFVTSQALPIATIPEVKKLNNLLVRIGENYAKRKKVETTEEQDEHDLEVVKAIHKRADMPRYQRRRLDKKNIKNLRKNG